MISNNTILSLSCHPPNPCLLFLPRSLMLSHPQVVHCSHLSFLFSFTLLAVLLFIFFLFAAAYSTRKLCILLLFIYFLPLLLYVQMDASSAGYTSLHCSNLLPLLSHGSLFLFFFLLLYIVYRSFLFHMCVQSCCMHWILTICICKEHVST